MTTDALNFEKVNEGIALAELDERHTIKREAYGDHDKFSLLFTQEPWNKDDCPHFSVVARSRNAQDLLDLYTERLTRRTMWDAEATNRLNYLVDQGHIDGWHIKEKQWGANFTTPSTYVVRWGPVTQVYEGDEIIDLLDEYLGDDDQGGDSPDDEPTEPTPVGEGFVVFHANEPADTPERLSDSQGRNRFRFMAETDTPWAERAEAYSPAATVVVDNAQHDVQPGDVLDSIYAITQHRAPDGWRTNVGHPVTVWGNEVHIVWAANRVRSTSVGDVIYHPKSGRFWVVDSVGFQRIEPYAEAGPDHRYGIPDPRDPRGRSPLERDADEGPYGRNV